MHTRSKPQYEDEEDEVSDEIISQIPPTAVDTTNSTTNKNNNIKRFDFLSRPQTNSFTYFSDIPDSCKSGLNAEEVILGVDEAGRGPVLGPMVYAVCFIPKSKDVELKMMGVDDSKGLTTEKRSELFSTIQATEWIGWGIHACSAQDISESMLRRSKYNLNALAHDTTINLIKKTLEHNVNLKNVYIDTVGDPDKYRIKLEAIFPKIKIVVAKKADSLYPSVSAASICAKVLRDEMMENWQYIENGLNEKLGNQSFGSGYPSDPNTIAWINKSVDYIFGFPRLIRFSWSTASKLLEEKAAEVKWFSDEDEGDIRKFFSRKRRMEDEEDEENTFEKTPEVTLIPREPILSDLTGLEIMTSF